MFKIKILFLILVNEILRIILIKYWIKVNKNVIVFELKLMFLVFDLRDFKVFEKNVIEYINKVDNNDEKVKMFLLLIENGNLEVVEEFLIVLKDLKNVCIVDLIDFFEIYCKVGMYK